MARFNRRYGTNAGYAAGDALVQLSQLLRQGVGDYQRQQTIDEESGRRDQDYRLKLQQFLTQSEDRNLSRKVAEDTLAMNRETRAQQAADRAASAATAASGRSGLAKLLKMPSTVMEETPPPPEFAADPERLQPNILQALVKRPRSRDEAMTGLSPDEAGNEKVLEALLKLYPIKEPKAPEDFTLGEGQTRFDPSGRPKASVAKVEKPEKPFAEGKTPTELELYINDPTTPPAQRTIAQAALKSIRAAELERAEKTGAVAAGRAEQKATSDLERDVYKRRLKEYEEIHQTATQAGTTIDQLEELSGKVSVPTAGSRATGYLGRELGSRAQTNPDLTLFDSKAGALAPLVRSMGEKGNLSDSDIKRAMQLIPDKHDTDAVKAQKIAALRDYFGKALAAAGGRLQSPAGSPDRPSVAAPPGFAPRTP